MLKHTILITSLALSFISSTVAAAETFYVGAQYNQLTVEETARNATETLGTVSVLGGYQFNPFWSVEFRQHLEVNEQTPLPVLGAYQMQITSQQSVLLKGTYPLNEQFSLYGLIGVGSTKFDFTSLTNAPIPSGITANHHNNGLAVGFGAEYQLTPALSATLEYMQHRDLVFQGSQYNKLSLNGIALGLNYRF
jgi:opacity protein-like surface antigen